VIAVRLGPLLATAVALTGCTQDVMLVDVWDGGARDGYGNKDTPPWSNGDAGCWTMWPWMTFTPRAAQVIVALDRSTAMQASFAGTTRIAAVESALISTISTYQGRVKFGFEQFPADSADKYADCQRNSCCAGSVRVDPQLNNLKSISGFVQCSDPYYTPCPTPSYDSSSNAALAKVRDHFRAHTAQSDDDRYVLLITSSEPACSGLPASSDACDDATAAANDLGGMGVRVVVLTVGYQPGPGSCLKHLSETGSSLALPRNVSALYTPSTQSALASALNQFVAAVAETSCTQDSWDPPPPEGAAMTVSIDRTQLPEVDSTNDDGWSFANSAGTTITLSGNACQQWISSPSSKLYVNYACSSCAGPSACP
jgi:hypothetical protein